eukprot:m.187464 g.187464  ORF g.187464 m.187464 type:complete len:428 (+) comp18506_c0_seq3:3563-4846(+)
MFKMAGANKTMSTIDQEHGSVGAPLNHLLLGMSDVGRPNCSLYKAMAEYTAPGCKDLSDIPTTCLLESEAYIHADQSDPNLVATRMQLRDTLKPRIQVLHRLIQKMGEPNPIQVRSAIAHHIRSTMKIEMEHLSAKDTLDLVTNRIEANSDNAKLVKNMFHLMSKEYQKNRPLSELELSKEKLLQWHVAMFDNVERFSQKNVGNFRKYPVIAGRRLCPNREVVPQALGLLCEIVTQFGKKHRDQGDPLDTMLDVFVLAAFVQYHIVDIHPFEDGNGRMCRYVCKYILESCLPLPFPMYPSKTAYFHALREADQKYDEGHPRSAIVPLVLLSINSAIDGYRELMKLVPYPCIVAQSWPVALDILKEKELNSVEEDIPKMKAAFKTLAPYTFATVSLTCGPVIITKTTALSALPVDVGDDETEIDINAI